MKFLLISDIHLRDSNPRNRCDDFRETQFDKFNWCLELAKKENCIVLQAGDLFDSVRSSNKLISDTISTIKQYNLDFFTVSGNHDQRHRNRDLTNTHWGDEIPQIQYKKAFTILVIHKMVIQNEEDKIWHGQQNYSTARMLLAKNDYDLILSADNHKTFADEYKGKTLLNLGSMTRLTSAQINHESQVAIFDTDKNEYIIYKIPIKPAAEVFNLEQIEKNKETGEINDKIREYVDLLGGNSEMREWDFARNLDEFIIANNVKQEVQDIIKLTLEP